MHIFVCIIFLIKKKNDCKYFQTYFAVCLFSTPEYAQFWVWGHSCVCLATFCCCSVGFCIALSIVSALNSPATQSEHCISTAWAFAIFLEAALKLFSLRTKMKQKRNENGPIFLFLKSHKKIFLKDFYLYLSANGSKGQFTLYDLDFIVPHLAELRLGLYSCIYRVRTVFEGL